ncbi:hypothetical protein [Propionicimonas sp.]|uniref:hypothetical protein n=1 Tax=Propionicimonas sp. TaxID=1955623 RepID=UPI0039E2C0AA
MEWRYIGRHARPETIDGQEYEVAVHLATVDGAPVCVGVDVRATQLPLAGDPPPALGWAEVNTRVLKRLPLPQLVERAWRDHREITRAAASLAKGESFGVWRGPAQPAPSVPRRGRRPLLDTDGLVVVATAYLSTTRGRVAAVQGALAAHLGETGATRDQANKAIKAARDAGLLPPASTQRRGTK